jgi:hypothetical protein
MLDVDDYGVTALDQGALTAISGGDGGCQELAYAIGYGIGWLAEKAGELCYEGENYLLAEGILVF